MDSERIQPVDDRISRYRDIWKAFKRRKSAVSNPIDAITFDILDLSSEKPQDSTEYLWLTKFISQMSDEQVAAKMKQLKNSSIDIDDALAERLFLEAL